MPEELTNAENQNVDNIPADAYVWFEDSWQHEKKPHTHKYYQLTYVEEGYQYIHIDDKTYFAPQNHVVLIPSNTVHRTSSDSHSVILKVVLFKILPENDFYRNVQVFSAPTVLKEMIHYAEKWNKVVVNEVEQASFLQAMLISLPHFYKENNLLEIPTPKDQRITPICQYINDNYNYNVSAGELAELANMSERNMQRIFKKETGITLMKYIQLIRILKSIELIDTDQYTFTEIAYRVGYKSLSAFTNSYQTIMKMPIRKKIKKSDL